MANDKIQGSEQQTQNVTIGTQGNNAQPTPLGNMHPDQQSGQPDKHIPNQDQSSATNKDKAERNRE